MFKTTNVFPIIGGRKVENLVENIEALEITLADEHIKYLDSVVPLDLGFPHNMIVSQMPTTDTKLPHGTHSCNRVTALVRSFSTAQRGTSHIGLFRSQSLQPP